VRPARSMATAQSAISSAQTKTASTQTKGPSPTTSISFAARQFDRLNMEMVIEGMPDQIDYALCDPAFPKLPGGPYSHVILLGMGGSSLIGDILLGAYPHEFDRRFKIVRDYTHRLSLDEKPLVISCSYSGNTEETVSATKELHRSGASIVVLTSGGELAQFAKENDLPQIHIPGEREPTGFQPRCALGYMFTYLARILAETSISELPLSELREIPNLLRNPQLRAAAETLAFSLRGRIPIIYTASDYEQSIARIMKIKFNENAKRPAFYNCLPEANHNEMIGFTDPTKNHSKENYSIVYLRDPESHPAIDRRFQAMQNIFQRHEMGHVAFEKWSLTGPTRLSKIICANSFGDWCTYTAALLDGIDPTPVELVEEFKAELRAMATDAGDVTTVDGTIA
jgi:glucose/mannose-6-phosphate isomerase